MSLARSVPGPRSEVPGLTRGFALAGLVLALEGIALGIRFDADAITRAGLSWWQALLAHASVVPQVLIAGVTAAALIGGRRLIDELRNGFRETSPRRFAWHYLLAHLAGLVCFAALTALVFEGSHAPSPLLVILWAASGAATPLLLAALVVPARVAAVTLRACRRLIGLALLLGVIAWSAGALTAMLWRPLREGTLAGVHGLLALVASDALVHPADYVVGTERFWVTIAPACSGYQGIGLIWVFLAVYLWSFRDRLRFPRALLLIPLGTAAVWSANLMRIAALVLIGSTVSPAIARGGFHSYVGSLLFSGIALALAWGCHHSRFFLRADQAPLPGERSRPTRRSEATTAAYLMPMLAILASALIAGAFSAGSLELLYPLRMLATATALYLFRHAYRELRWTWSWQAALAGVAVFALWLALEPSTALAQPTGLPPGLAGLPSGIAYTWLAVRILGAVVTVPIAEELAFRGYLSRRVQAVDFSRVSLAKMSGTGLLVSSLLFGALHDRLLAGTLAGIVFAWVARRRGELTDAIVAHSVSNALLAAYVVATGSWALWG